jgi:excisionase family DNA binding protein
MTITDGIAAPTRQRTISVTQAAELLGISRTTAYECVRTGALPALRLGGRIVVPTQAIDNLLEAASAIPDA